MPTPDPRHHDPHLDALLAEAGWVQELARRLARDQATADDIAQSTLALALERRPASEGGLRPWLAKVTSTLARRRFRGDARRRAREALAVPVRGSKSEASDEVLMRFELQQGLARRVDELPEPYRRVLILRYYEGQSVKEIARATGSPAGTVRSQITRGLDRIRLQYGHGHDSEDAGALGFFLIAAGSKSGTMSRRAAEILTMQTSTKVAAATAATLALAVVVIAPFFSRSAPLDTSKAEALPVPGVPTSGDIGSAADLVGEGGQPMDQGEVTGRISAEEVLVSAAAPTPAVTILRARILDEDREPLPGATLRPIHMDGRAFGTTLAQSDSDGHVVLALTDDGVRAWRGQALDMMFAAAADDHATEFLNKKPRMHGETDLGDLLLAPGGALVGTCLGDDGRAISGAIVSLSPSAITEDPETMRFTGPSSNVTRLTTVTADDGTFELSGIPAGVTAGRAGSVRLWAHAPGHFWTTTGPRSVTPGARIDVGPILLEKVPSKLRIDGVVVGPHGLPLPGARVHYFSLDSPQVGQVQADARGHFTAVPRDDSTLELVARDALDEFGMNTSVLARRGDRVELMLLPRRILSIVVTDMEGEPVHDAWILPHLVDERSTFADGGRLVPSEDRSYTNEEGRSSLVVPGQSFGIHAKKGGYGSKRLGPFDYDTVPETLQIRLPRGPVVSGRVLSYGVPVEDARVIVGRHHPVITMTDGMVNRITTSGGPSTTTDREGRFMISLDPGGTTVPMVAMLDGLATDEVLVDVSLDTDVRGVELHLTEGGAIEGTVLPPPGMKATGLHVAASRGDGSPVSTRVDGEGRYRITGLTPGEWHVEGRFMEVNSEMLFVADHPEDQKLRMNVVVQDRKTTEFEVDMRHLGDVEILGQLLIDDSPPPAGWTLEIVPPFHERWRTEAPSTEIDDEGRFTLTTRPGRAELRLAGPLPEQTPGGAPGRAMVVMWRPVHLQGPRFHWEETLTTSPIVEPVEGGADRARFLRGDPTAGDRELTLVRVDVDGVLRARVPVGHSKLQVPTRAAPRENDWETVRAVDVK